MIRLLLIVCCLIVPAAMAETNNDPLNYPTMLMGLFGGLAMFLYGMEKMTQALSRAAGSRMKYVLAKLTTHRVSGVLTGAGLTAVIQSSSVTTVLVVGFVSAGLMSLNQAVGIIMGANIGTTITAQIIAFKVTQVALAFIALGFIYQVLAKTESGKNYSNIILGLGLLFLGMNTMSDAMSPLRTFAPFVDFMARMNNPLFAIMIAALFTALVQSSSATTGIVIVLATQGFVSLESGIAMAMGANVGTCVTAVLAAIGKSAESKQAAGLHLLFNIFGVLIWLPLLAVLASFATSISPSYPDLVGMERLAVETPRQIANANTIFNVMNTIIMLPFSHLFVLAVKKLVPQPESTKQQRSLALKYVREDFLATPDIALEQANLEVSRVGRRVVNMLNAMPPLAQPMQSADDKQQVRETLRNIEKIEDEVDLLHGKILRYLGQLRQFPLTEVQSKQQINLVSITDHLENIADTVVNVLLPLSYHTLESNLMASNEMRTVLDTTQSRVREALLDSVNAIRRNDDQLAENVLSAKREINVLLEKVLARQAERLVQNTDERLDIFRAQMEWVNGLKHIYTLSKRIAKLQLRKAN
ncbi:Na/Pi cotransporter family protein [Motilimonas sp. KMU-193]|uniref:Na/Pi cotransporter family protein n=1 Tax=Motilimonas sp. KMU-193 TaxID=3388668 RepID=UPI00396AF0EC